ncbi:MAG TPA: peptidylprolyl isomerase [bacterium]|nr:peptidylprolyl isomerase [bacterium]HPR88220.1 peptidylprolyl isomerase [bacterium]
MKKIVLVLACAALLAAGCGKKEQGENKPAAQAQKECTALSDTQLQQLLEKVKQTPMDPVEGSEVAVLETNYGKMVATFFTDKAPMTCTSFKRLVKAGYYDCTQFHRVIKGFMIQGGDVNSKDAIIGNEGEGGPGYSLPAEFNDTPHDLGILSMARRGDDINSAGSQFFICLSREGTRGLDGQYTAFGKLIEGIDVLQKIGDAAVTMSAMGENSVPVQPIYIKKAYMEKR